MNEASHSVPDLRPNLPAHDAAKIILDRLVEKFQDRLRLAACADVDAVKPVHRLRVSTRRLAAAMKLFKRYLDPDSSKRLSVILKHTRKAAGDARDLDVLMKRYSDLDSPDPYWMQQLRQQRIEAQVPIRECFQQLEQDHQFQQHVDRLVATPSTVAGLPETFQQLAQLQLNRSAKRCFKRAVFDTDDFDQLHQFRIRVKRVRYSVEILREAWPRKATRKVLRTISRLQDLLGKIQDAVVAMERIREEELDPETRAARLKREKRILKDCRKQFESWWTQQRLRKLQKRIRRLVDA